MPYLGFGSEFESTEGAKRYLHTYCTEFTRFSAEQCLNNSEKIWTLLVQDSTLFGGVRGVLIEGASDRHTRSLAPMLKEARVPIAVVGGILTGGSSLRKLFTENKWNIQEYRMATDRSLAELARNALALTPPDIGVMDILIARLPKDTGVALSWLKTLALFCQARGRCGMEEINQAIPSMRDSEMFPALDAILDRNPGLFLSMVPKLEKPPGIGMLVAAQRNFQRLALVRALIESGLKPDDAIAQLYPPVPPFARGAMAKRAARWNSRQIEIALGRITRADASIKRGVPGEIEAEAALLFIAQMA